LAASFLRRLGMDPLYSGEAMTKVSLACDDYRESRMSVEETVARRRAQEEAARARLVASEY